MTCDSQVDVLVNVKNRALNCNCPSLISMFFLLHTVIMVISGWEANRLWLTDYLHIVKHLTAKKGLWYHGNHLHPAKSGSKKALSRTQGWKFVPYKFRHRWFHIREKGSNVQGNLEKIGKEYVSLSIGNCPSTDVILGTILIVWNMLHHHFCYALY